MILFIRKKRRQSASDVTTLHFDVPLIVIGLPIFYDPVMDFCMTADFGWQLFLNKPFYFFATNFILELVLLSKTIDER